MKKKEYRPHTPGVIWRGLAVAVCLAIGVWSSDVMAQSFTFTGETKDKVYGGPLCTSNAAINVKLTFVPQAAFTPLKNVTFKVYLGESEIDRAEIYNKEVTPLAADALNINGSAVLDITSGLVTISKNTAKGMFISPKYLTIRDAIGYAKYLATPEAPPTAETICNLASPSDDTGTTTVKLCVLAKYSVQEATGIGGVPQTVAKEATECVDVQYDLTPPNAASGVVLTPSETQISLNWNYLTNHQYDVYVSTQPFTKDTQQEVVPTATNGASKVVSAPYMINNLNQSTTYYVALRAYDAAGNVGELSEVFSGSTVELTDFYEAYRKAGGADKGFDGGFCFIATAAYGTYDHSHVQILRDFRDRHLLTNGPGRAFVAWYYHHSPAWATWIRQHPKTKVVVQAALLPLIAASAFLVRLSLAAQLALLLALLLLVLLVRYRRRWLVKIAPLALLLACWTHTPAKAESPRNFGLELRAGIFQPQIDKETGLNQGATPYKTIFGNPLQPYLEVHIEWLVFKKYGSIGIGGSAGFTWAEGKSLGAGATTTTTDGTTTSNNSTSLWIIPLRLDVSYRMDYFAINHGFPLVPYVRTGLDYYVWFVTDPSGAIAKDPTAGSDSSAIGGRLGFHVGLGMQFLLDIFDRRTALTFDNEVGVNHTYLFFEWNFSWVGTFTPGLNLSDSSFRAGLLFQF